VAQAYSVLQDPVSRALYNIKQGIVKDSIEERRRINMMKRKDAEAFIELSKTTFQKIRQDEIQNDGIVILEALYGDVSIDADVDSSDDNVGRCIDVTVPIQCMVRGSALIIYGGGSKAWLEGFYDPNEDNDVENLLYVRYRFLGRLHECIVRDSDELVLPLEEHLVADQDDNSEFEDDTDADTDSDYSSDEDMDEARLRARRMRRKEKQMLRVNPNSIRHRVQPRAQALAEIRAIKARRRRRLFTGLATVAIITGLYFAQKWKWIDLRQYLPEFLREAWNREVVPRIGGRFVINPVAVQALNYEGRENFIEVSAAPENAAHQVEVSESTSNSQ